MRIFLAIVLALIAPAQLAAQTPPPPYVKPEGLQKVSAHVHVIPDNSVPLVSNIGIIVGDTGVLVVDTGPEAAPTARRFWRRRASSPARGRSISSPHTSIPSTISARRRFPQRPS